MKPWAHQVEMAEQIADKLREYGLCYVVAEERTGKTLATIGAIEGLAVNTVLVITKKVALAGWLETLTKCSHKKIYRVVNYHRVKNVTGSFDMVILDESHNYIGGLPEPSAIHNQVAKFTRGKPIVYMSATPCAQGPAYLYHQLSLSTWSPFNRYTDYHDWHREFGVPYTKYLYGNQIAMYDKVERVIEEVEHLFVSKTRKEIGFEQEPEDKIHWITLSEATLHVYRKIMVDKVYKFLKAGLLVADTVSKLRFSLHMLEGGTIKVRQKPKMAKTGKMKNVSKGFILSNCEKIDYILETWGDTNSLVIMYNFIAEKVKLEERFKNALILQATSYAEGIDLSDRSTLVIYSQDYSTARHTQRRARQTNMDRKEPITVHYLLVRGGVSEQVYETVSVNKLNYVDTFYKRTSI